LLACGDRQLVGCVRASNSVAEVSGRRRAQRSVLQWQRGAWTGAQLVESRKGFHGRKGVDNRYRGGKAMAPSRPEPGVRKGIAGAKVFARWKALQAVFLVVRSRGRLGGGLGGSHEPVTRERCESVGEATGVSEARRARITTGRQRPSRRSTRTTGTCSPPKRIALSWNRRLLDCTGAQALDAREPTMRGYWYEEVRWQKSVQRIARCDVR